MFEERYLEAPRNFSRLDHVILLRTTNVLFNVLFFGCEIMLTLEDWVTLGFRCSLAMFA